MKNIFKSLVCAYAVNCSDDKSTNTKLLVEPKTAYDYPDYGGGNNENGSDFTANDTADDEYNPVHDTASALADGIYDDESTFFFNADECLLILGYDGDAARNQKDTEVGIKYNPNSRSSIYEDAMRISVLTSAPVYSLASCVEFCFDSGGMDSCKFIDNRTGRIDEFTHAFYIDVDEKPDKVKIWTNLSTRDPRIYGWMPNDNGKAYIFAWHASGDDYNVE